MSKKKENKYTFDLDKVYTVEKKTLKRCKHCSKILSFVKDGDLSGEYTQQYLWNNNVCSKWCFEMEHPPEIKYTCKFCDNVTAPIINSKGVTKGFRTICNSCISQGRGHLTPRISKEIEQDKTLDIVIKDDVLTFIS